MFISPSEEAGAADFRRRVNDDTKHVASPAASVPEREGMRLDNTDYFPWTRAVNLATRTRRLPLKKFTGSPGSMLELGLEIYFLESLLERSGPLFRPRRNRPSIYRETSSYYFPEFFSRPSILRLVRAER